jgi:hypothetical protein
MINFSLKNVSLCQLLLAWVCIAATGNYYSDNTRELFFVPQSSAASGSDFVFARDGTPQVNPANLAIGTTNDLALSYAAYYQNAFSTSTVSYAGPIDALSGIGLSLSYLYNPSIAGTMNLELDNDSVPVYDPNKILYSSYSIIYFHAGYGRRLLAINGVGLFWGLGVNASRQRLPFDTYKGYSLGLDAGLLCDIPESGFRFSILCDNITTQYTKWSANYSEYAYPHLMFGAGWQKDLPYIYGSLKINYKSLDLLNTDGISTIDMESFWSADTGNVDATKVFKQKTGNITFAKDPFDFLLLGSLGVEYCIKDVFTLRVGGNLITKAAFGCGINMFNKQISIDAAYVSHDLAPTYQIGITYRR